MTHISRRWARCARHRSGGSTETQTAKCAEAACVSVVPLDRCAGRTAAGTHRRRSGGGSPRASAAPRSLRGNVSVTSACSALDERRKLTIQFRSGSLGRYAATHANFVLVVRPHNGRGARSAPKRYWQGEPHLQMRPTYADAAYADLLHPIVRCFLRDLDVVDVALAGAGRRDANELRLPLQLGNRGAAGVAHAGAQSSHELVDHRGNAALVRDTPFDALRYELVASAAGLEIEFVLKVPVAAAAAHGADRSHPAVLLVAASLEQDQLARALIGAREQVSDHRAARADGNGLDDVARVPNASIGDDRNVPGGSRARALHDGADHRHPDAGDDARRA